MNQKGCDLDMIYQFDFIIQLFNKVKQIFLKYDKKEKILILTFPDVQLIINWNYYLMSLICNVKVGYNIIKWKSYII